MQDSSAPALGRPRVRAAVERLKGEKTVLAIAVGYVLLRLYAVASVHQVWVHPDSSTYRATAGGPHYSFVSLTGAAIRPWTTPLFYALLPSDGVRVAAQLLVSIVAWLTLALCVMGQLRSPRVRTVALVAVLAVSCSFFVTNWDLAILSESLAISFAALLTAAWIRFVDAPTVWTAVAVVSTSVLWMFTKTAMVPLIGLTCLGCAALAFSRNGRPLRVAVAVALAVLTVWGVVATTRQDSAFQARDGFDQTYFSENFGLNLRYRILNHPDQVAWFRAHGMPEPVGLEPYPPGPSIYDTPWESFWPWYARYRDNKELNDWVKTDGQRTYALFTATHAVPLLRDYLDSVPQLLTPPEYTMAGYATPTASCPNPSRR